MDSKEYSWKWVTQDELLSHGACELLYAHLTVSSADGRARLYDGENTTGTQIVRIHSSTKTGLEFSPKKPVYCRRGLYVGDTSKIEGIFVQWRNRPSKEG